MKLSKARTRDARCVSYGQYMLIDRATNVVIDGAWPCDFSLTLEDVEARFDD